MVNGSVPNTSYRAYPTVDPRLTEGTLGRRFFAYIIDIVVIAVITAVLWVVIGIIGLITFGLDGLQVPRVFVSSRTGAGLPELRRLLAQAATAHAEAPSSQEASFHDIPA